MIMYAEGGTTNGKYLLRFKKGAFYGMKAVKPILMKYHGGFEYDPANSCLDMFAHGILLGSGQPYSWVHVEELPVFKPNDYFVNVYCK